MTIKADPIGSLHNVSAQVNTLLRCPTETLIENSGPLLACGILSVRFMILDTVDSINGVAIRLTEERWDHIVGRRPYMATYYEKVLDAVQDPSFILRGARGSLVAVLALGRRRYLLVFYRELSKLDGFIITAYIDDAVDRSKIIWRADR